MPISTLIGAVSYPIPEYGDSGWAQGSGNLTQQLVALASIATATYLIGTVVTSVVPQASAVSATGTGNWFDITSIILPNGTWDISGVIGFSPPITGFSTLCAGGIGTAADNNTIGLILGDTEFQQTPPVTGYDTSIAIPKVIVTITDGGAIYYLKSMALYTAADPTSYGRITAVQIGT